MKKYVCCFTMGVQKALEYRTDFFAGYAGSIFPIIIQVSMWTAIYGGTGGGSLFGYTYQQMILYTFFVGVVGKFLSTGFEYEMNEDIKNGGLNKFIVKPVNYCIYRWFCFVGERMAVLGGFLILLAVLIAIFMAKGFFLLNVYRILCFFLSLLLALLLDFSVFFCVGISGLWLYEISRVYPAITIVLTIFSGGIFPLDILGKAANQVIMFLPFKYMLQFPVDILTGRGAQIPYLASIGIQAAWAVLFLVAAQCLWQRGIKRYVAVGG